MLEQSRGVVQTSGIHICNALREEPTLETQGEMASREINETEGEKIMTHT